MRGVVLGWNRIPSAALTNSRLSVEGKHWTRSFITTVYRDLYQVRKWLHEAQRPSKGHVWLHLSVASGPQFETVSRLLAVPRSSSRSQDAIQLTFSSCPGVSQRIFSFEKISSVFRKCWLDRWLPLWSKIHILSVWDSRKPLPILIHNSLDQGRRQFMLCWFFICKVVELLGLFSTKRAGEKRSCWNLAWKYLWRHTFEQFKWFRFQTTFQNQNSWLN